VVACSGFCFRFGATRVFDSLIGGFEDFVSFLGLSSLITHVFRVVVFLVARFPPTAFRRLGLSFSDSLNEENDSWSL